MAIEGIDYQVVRSEDAVASPNACELIEVTTALACASGDSALAVQIKTGISRFFADLKKAPYKTLFNPTVSGARAFSTTATLRAIEIWIDGKKRSVKKSGPAWGVVVHGNRVLAAVVFAKYGEAMLSQPIEAYGAAFKQNEIDALCEAAYDKMVDRISNKYSGKFLATLFKNPSMSKDVFDFSKG
jgi:hypothetical protein